MAFLFGCFLVCFPGFVSGPGLLWVASSRLLLDAVLLPEPLSVRKRENAEAGRISLSLERRPKGS